MAMPQLLQRRLLVLEVGAVYPWAEAGWGERSVLSGNIPDRGQGLRTRGSSPLLLLNPPTPLTLQLTLPLLLPERGCLRV